MTAPNPDAAGEFVAQLARSLLKQQQFLVTAESCTGGLIAASCTAQAGSSQWFERGMVTYSNAAKTELLGVPSALIQTHGAVSRQVAEAMALGALKHSRATLAIAVTGVAGPTGGTPEKPLGLVWFAWARNPGHCEVQSHIFSGQRQAVQQAAVCFALQGLLQRLAARN